MTDAITTWLATLPARPCGEVIVPATIDFPILQAISAADLVPVLVDVRPGLYVAEAERVVPAICEKTVGVILPWTYGNCPDLQYIAPACALYEVAYWSEPPPSRIVGLDRDCLVGDLARCLRRATAANDPEAAAENYRHILAVADEVMAGRTWRRLYDALSEYIGRITLPSTLVQEPARWTCMPLLAASPDERARIAYAMEVERHLSPFANAITFMRGVPTDDECAQLGTHMVCGALAGARDIGARGFTVPLVDGIADVLAEVLG
jgi:hypothetical protein